MNSETRTCQNCKTEFTIEPEDFKFYEKIKVPPPTFCPKCRWQRRAAFYNLFNLYQRPCDLCKKDTISMYAPEAPYKTYCPICWWSDQWDWSAYGRDYDFSRPFFEQFNELWHEVPMLGLSLDPTAENSPWNNHAGNLKNSYLLFHADFTEDSAYGFYLDHCANVLDCSLIIKCELCYDMMHSYRNSRCFGGRSQVANSIDCAFLKDSFNCQNCFASANLRNKKYYIFNKPYTKEGYFEEIKKWNLGSYKTYKEVQKLAEEHWKKFPPKPNFDEYSVTSTGSHVFQSKNCKECYEVVAAEDSKFLSMMSSLSPTKDSYDITAWGDNLSLSYEGNVVGGHASRLKFCQEAGLNLFDTEYGKLSTGGSNHFGCVSVKKGDYVIFNKRYSKEEFEKLREKIVRHMNEMPYVDKKGRVYKYGEFFPVELSPFAYNETIANNFFPLTKEKILENGYKWREAEIRKHDTTIQSAELPDHIKDAPDSILNEVIKCSTCERGYRIIPMELKFLRERNLPLPRQCPFCRIEEKFNQWVKNLRLIGRVCDKCGKNFQTKYTPEEAPMVYCKDCYKKDVI